MCIHTNVASPSENYYHYYYCAYLEESLDFCVLHLDHCHQQQWCHFDVFCEAVGTLKLKDRTDMDK